MEKKNQEFAMLDLLQQAAFRVENGVITHVNTAASPYWLRPGQPIDSMLSQSAEDYAAFSDGCLYLPLTIGGISHRSTVIKVDTADVFILEHQQDPAQFQAMALAAAELRIPLSGVMAGADKILAMVDDTTTSKTQETLAQMNRRLMQMHRIVSNMSDVSGFAKESQNQSELLEIRSLLEEILSKSAHALSLAGITLSYQLPTQPICTLANSQQLERAVYNLISNAAKYSPANGTIQVDVSCRGNRLAICVSDQGCGIQDRTDVFTRYLRQPTLEDSRNGIGLGMVLVRSAAIAHGGTVLIHQPGGGGTRVTMTLAIRTPHTPQVRSTRMRIDYAGEYDHCLLELSDVLPPELYAPEVFS